MCLLENCTILIPTRNRPGVLARSIQKMIDIGMRDEKFIILDDESQDPDAVQKSVSVLPNAKVYYNKPRTGQAMGRNKLAELADTPFLLFLDDDMYPVELGNLPEILHKDNLPNDVGALVLQTVREHDGYREMPANLPSGTEVYSFLGGGVLFRKEAFTVVGGFRNFFCYGFEEPDCALRLWRKGWKLLAECSTVVEHYHRHGQERNMREYFFLYSRNRIILHALNYPGFYGLPLGILKSIKQFFRYSYKTSTLRGILAGIIVSFQHRGEATKLSIGQYREYKKKQQEQNRYFNDLRQEDSH